MADYKTFDEWFDEAEPKSSRRERFENSVLSCNEETMTEWMRLAWDVATFEAEKKFRNKEQS